MALNKHVVIDHLEQEHKAREAAQKHAHAESVEKWKAENRDIRRAQRESVPLITALTSELANPEPDWSAIREQAKRLGQYDSPLSTAARGLRDRPELAPTTTMLALRRVIELIKSHDSETVTVADLRGLGVLDYVRVAGR
jgi:hypothetical protein